MADTPVTPVYVLERSYLVTVWPEDADSPNADSFCLTVAWRQPGHWAIFRGRGEGGLCMDQRGRFSAGAMEDEDRDEWLRGHRFTLNEALRIAREWAPKMKLGIWVAAEVLAEEQAQVTDG